LRISLMVINAAKLRNTTSKALSYCNYSVTFVTIQQND